MSDNESDKSDNDAPKDPALEEFNDKYNLEIKDMNITSLDLEDEDIGEEGFQDLCKMDFKELKELNLRNNNITDINLLEQVKFEKLETLNLTKNQITDISVLEKVNFKELKELYLYENKISDIDILDKVNFKEIEEINLRYNNI